MISEVSVHDCLALLLLVYGVTLRKDMAEACSLHSDWDVNEREKGVLIMSSRSGISSKA
jgi:hypothetical protein